MTKKTVYKLLDKSRAAYMNEYEYYLKMDNSEVAEYWHSQINALNAFQLTVKNWRKK